MSNLVYFFGNGNGDSSLLGGKGAKLDIMTKLGLPVPFGFTISTDAYRLWRNYGMTDEIKGEVKEAISTLEERVGLELGSDKSPLFVSVRSGAPVSMPGMMDTIINVGATDESIAALAKIHGEERFAYETYREFLRSYVNSVGIDANFNDILSEIRTPKLISFFRKNSTINWRQWEDLISNLKLKAHSNQEIKFPKIPKTDFLTRDLIYSLFSEEIRVTGSLIQELKRVGSKTEEGRVGRIEQLTEDNLLVRWKDDSFEKILIKDLSDNLCGRTTRIFSFEPVVERVSLQYLEDVESFGEFVPDTLRLRRNLQEIPLEPIDQILESVNAVFESWDSNRAIEYREIHKINDDIGTAVNVQHMVFGNLSERSGTAVYFSSSPKTGIRRITGEYLLRMQGEQLVSGEDTPQDISEIFSQLPEVGKRLQYFADTLEGHFGEIQDMEVTWEGDKADDVYILQTRNAILTPKGRIGYALRRQKSGEISVEELIRKIPLEDIISLANQETVVVPSGVKPIASGKSVNNGILVGKLVVDVDYAQNYPGHKIILCRPITSPNDLSAIRYADGLLTAKGGEYSHAGIVARQLEKIAVVGCSEMEILTVEHLRFGELELKVGDELTIDGYNGFVYNGKLKVEKGRSSQLLAEVIKTAQSLVEELPIFYQLKYHKDLESLALGSKKITELGFNEEMKSKRILYDVGFDCLLASGLFEGKKYSRRELNVKINEAVQTTYQAFIDNGIREVRLQDNNDYANKIKEHCGSYESIVKKYMISMLKLAHRSHGKIHIQNNNQQYQTGQNCVIIYPWAVEESLFNAAKVKVQ